MKRKFTARKQLHSLTQQLKKLTANAQQLQQTQRDLVLQQQVLASCCELLHMLRTGAVPAGWMSGQGSCLPDELPLLQQLGVCLGEPSEQQQQGSDASQHQEEAQSSGTTSSSVSSSRSEDDSDGAAGDAAPAVWGLSGPGGLDTGDTYSPAAAAAAPAAAAAACETADGGGATSPAAAAAAAAAAMPQRLFVVAPGDYMGVMRYALSQPPFPGAASLSMQQFGQHYSAVVKDLALCLALAEQQGREQDMCDSGEVPPLLKLQQLVLHHSHLMVSIMLLHPDDIVNKVRVLNKVRWSSQMTQKRPGSASTGWRNGCS